MKPMTLAELNQVVEAVGELKGTDFSRIQVDSGNT